MATVQNFENLEIWKMARNLVSLIYTDVKNCKDFAFKDQITRAGISVMNNISEGFGRNSDQEFCNFLNIAKGSGCEIKSMYYIAEDQKYISEKDCVERRENVQKLINSLSRFMKYLKSGNKLRTNSTAIK